VPASHGLEIIEAAASHVQVAETVGLLQLACHGLPPMARSASVAREHFSYASRLKVMHSQPRWSRADMR
jgi:hypothetical protein